MIYPSFLIEKNAKYWKKFGTYQFMSFHFLENKLSHLVHNCLGIKNILVTWSTLLSLLRKMQKNAAHLNLCHFIFWKTNYLIWCTIILASRIYWSHDIPFFPYWQKCKILEKIRCIFIYLISVLEKNYHLMHNFLAINNILVTWSTLHMWISKKGKFYRIWCTFFLASRIS